MYLFCYNNIQLKISINYNFNAFLLLKSSVSQFEQLLVWLFNNIKN